MSPFNERMPKGISWHQPNDQATARVGKRGKLMVKITKPMLQLKLWHLALAAEWLWCVAYIKFPCQSHCLFIFQSLLNQTNDVQQSSCPPGYCEVPTWENTCSCLIIFQMCSKNQCDITASVMWFMFYFQYPLKVLFVFHNNKKSA